MGSAPTPFTDFTNVAFTSPDDEFPGDVPRPLQPNLNLRSFLLGDTNANKAVNSSDISQTKAQSGTAATASNFRTDVTVSGLINSSDISTVKSKSGTAIP
jgi:hypothetical protein